MSPKSDINLVLLTSHDYLFYASKDYGASAHPADLIGNYALMYGLNRGVSEVRRLIDGNKPHYDEDLPKMGIYATPAAPTSAIRGKFDARPRIGSKRVHFKTDSRYAKITWNSTGSSLLWTMPKEKINIPKTGYYDKLVPLVTFYFYTVGGSIPGIFRVGKKYSPARLELFPLEVKEKEGMFHPTCPVNVVDLPEDTEILEGSLVTVPPAPILFNSELNGKYIEGKDSTGMTHRIPIPNRERFANSWI